MSPTRISDASRRPARVTGSTCAARGGSTSATDALLVRLRRDSEVRLQRLPTFGELRLGVLVGYGRDDDHVLAVLPVHRCRHAVAGGQLQRVAHSQDLVEVTTGERRLGE